MPRPKKIIPEAAPASKPRKTRTPKSLRYVIVDKDGAAGPMSDEYTSNAKMIDDITLGASPGDDTVIVYREVRRGKLETKVRIGKL